MQTGAGRCLAASSSVDRRRGADPAGPTCTTAQQPLGPRSTRRAETMKFVLFYLPTVGTSAQIRSGMSGTNTQNYQNMLWQIREQLRFADDAGFWGACFTEHHFHIEGIEV